MDRFRLFDVYGLKEKIEIATNVVVILLAIFAGYILFDTHKQLAHEPSILHSSQSDASASQPVSLARQTAPSLVGQRVSLKNISWSKATQTLIVAVSTKCHFCISSAEFYSHLTTTIHSVPIVFVLPQDPPESLSFLSTHNIKPDKSLSSPLSDVDVEGTPTILLVDVDGTIKKSWVGELSKSGQDEVLHSVQTQTISSLQPSKFGHP